MHFSKKDLLSILDAQTVGLKVFSGAFELVAPIEPLLLVYLMFPPPPARPQYSVLIRVVALSISVGAVVHGTW